MSFASGRLRFYVLTDQIAYKLSDRLPVKQSVRVTLLQFIYVALYIGLGLQASSHQRLETSCTSSISAYISDASVALINVIPRLHDQVGSTSCYTLAGQASLMFARSCKRGIAVTLLEKTVDGDANSALEVQSVSRVLKGETVTPAFCTPVMERWIRPCVLQITRYSAVDHHLQPICGILQVI